MSNYDDSKIKTLSSLEHIRSRPGMYIGRLGSGNTTNDGIYVLLKEVLDNCVDEYIMGFGKRIHITIEGKRVIVRDFGRGIPQGKLVECVSMINTGGKFNDDVFQFSVGMNGVGTKAVNALSSLFIAESFRDGKLKRATFANGVLESTKTEKTKEPDGTQIIFEASEELFGVYEYQMEFVGKRLWRYAYLNSGLSLYLNGERFYSKNGLQDLIESEVDENKLYDVIYYREKTVEFAFTHSTEYGENYYSFANGQYTNDGGTHLSAFKEGILKGINEYANKNFDGHDVREGIIGSISIKIKNPMFESQTKNKLGNNDIRSWIVGEVKDAIVNFLHRNKPCADVLLEKIAQNEQVRKEISNVKKQAKEAAKKMSLKIPKLRDCKYHLNGEYKKAEQLRLAHESTIFITEGESASATMVMKRNVYTQAIFSLKGKLCNAFKIEKSSKGRKIEALYKNAELYYIMQSLGVEESVENLRYQKIVIATDADDDGMHIRNLVIAFFLTFFEQLVRSGHLYVLETPLYRVRTPKKTMYCYSDTERDVALAELGKSAELTRFKGLGEISPAEFGQFIGKDIRLVSVPIDHMSGIPEMLEFYMGENTPERRQYIMEHLL